MNPLHLFCILPFTFIIGCIAGFIYGEYSAEKKTAIKGKPKNVFYPNRYGVSYELLSRGVEGVIIQSTEMKITSTCTYRMYESKKLSWNQFFNEFPEAILHELVERDRLTSIFTAAQEMSSNA